MRALAAAILLALILSPGAAADATVARSDLDAAMEWLAGALERGEGGDEFSPYIAEAAAAAGLDPAAWPPGAPVIDLVEETYEEHAGAPLINRLRPLHALALAGRANATDPRAEATLLEFSGGQFGILGRLNDDFWALIALRALGLPAQDERLQAAASYILANQEPDGGWGWQASGGSDSDDTAMALVALARVGRLNASVVERALGFLADQTHLNGGVGLLKETGPNCNSTVWAIRAYAESGAAIPQRAWQYLQGQRLPTGAYRFGSTADVSHWCTAEVATLLGDALRHCWEMDGYGGRGDPAPGCPGGARGAPGLSPLAVGAAVGAVAATAWVRMGGRK